MKATLNISLFVLLLGIVAYNLYCCKSIEGMADNTGIPLSDIPEGDEDLYILKSEVVPPVCPKCPDAATCPRQKPCPACPPCARCPEPAFTCKKVPNYASNNQSQLPLPMLNTFSAFK